MTNLTHEQGLIVQSTSQNLVVQAYAGTGKTFTLTALANEFSQQRILYIAYNKSMAVEAQGKFGANVTCVTSHSLAYKDFGAGLKHKLEIPFTAREVQMALDDKVNEKEADAIKNVVLQFLYSGEFVIKESVSLLEKLQQPFGQKHGKRLFRYAEIIWKKMIDSADGFPAIHDTYLKLYQLSKPHLNYDIILLDEAQDTNPCVMSFIFSQQHARVILVGDEHQSIYKFRGAINALDTFVGAERFFLTQSFRFGTEVSTNANGILRLKRRDLPTLKGFENKNTVVSVNPHEGRGSLENFLSWLDYDSKPVFLHRTVAECVRSALFFMANEYKVAWVGGVSSYNFQEIMDLYSFWAKEWENIRNKLLLVQYKSFDDYAQFAADTGDPSMNRNVDFITCYKEKTAKIFSILRRHAVSVREADVLICTGHRSKGLEFNNVIMVNDFRDVNNPERPLFPDRVEDEINLNYVACTRAMERLALSYKVDNSIKRNNHY